MVVDPFVAEEHLRPLLDAASGTDGNTNRGIVSIQLSRGKGSAEIQHHAHQAIKGLFSRLAVDQVDRIAQSQTETALNERLWSVQDWLPAADRQFHHRPLVCRTAIIKPYQRLLLTAWIRQRNHCPPAYRQTEYAVLIRSQNISFARKFFRADFSAGNNLRRQGARLQKWRSQLFFQTGARHIQILFHP